LEKLEVFDPGKDGDLAVFFRMRPLDTHLAALFQRMDPDMDPLLGLAVKILSARTREGHVCLDLAGRDGIWPRALRMAGMEASLDACRRKMATSSLVGERAEEIRPLILAGNRLYLRRYFRAESGLAEGLLKRAREDVHLPDAVALKEALDRFFPGQPQGPVNMQVIAAFAATRKKLCVVVGGPGTGKTTTVCRLLATLCSLVHPLPEVVLAAPTGKAAGRLAASITAGKVGLGGLGEGLLAAIPESASTLHRLLGAGQGGRFRYHRDNPLSADLVVVDEVSMVDLFLMARLVEALKPQARLILLGDRFQLSSVAPGAVLGEICKGAVNQKSVAFARDFESTMGESLRDLPVHPRVPVMADCVVELTQSWRFDAAGGIGQLACALNEGCSEGVRRMLIQEKSAGVCWCPLVGPGDLEAILGPWVKEGFGDLMQAEDPESGFAALERFRILCLLREGPFGVEGLNSLAEGILRKEGFLRMAAPWYAGRPVMVGRNDPATGLFNGDVGITLKDGKTGEIRVYFPWEGGGFRAFHPLRLPDVETVFAMTVHKSQGSEFDRVLLVLPDRDTPVLTREILYTAVTRARQKVVLAGGAELLALGAGRTIRRASGLGETLWRVQAE